MKFKQLIFLFSIIFSISGSLFPQTNYWQYLIKNTRRRDDANYLKRFIRFRQPIAQDAKKPLFKTLIKFDFTPAQINVLFAQLRYELGNFRANKIINSNRLPFGLKPNKICKGLKRKKFFKSVPQTRGGSPADVILSPIGKLICVHNFYWD